MSTQALFGISDAVMDGNGRGGPQGAETHVQATAKQMRRVLLVALGGTGQLIGVHVKAHFIAQYGRLPDWVRIIAFDTANEPLVVQLPDGQQVWLEPGTEFVNIGQVPVGRIIRHRDRQRAITERLGASLLQLPPTVLLNGAKQVRMLGLLALYWHYAAVEAVLQQAIWYLAGRDNQQQLGIVDTARGMNIFVANSLCGGTGAGVFLDVAFLLRELVGELGDLGDFCQITGLGVLPGAFKDVKGPSLEENTVASLMELNHVMTRNDFHAVYPNGRTIEATNAPFNLYYVLDGVDERGSVWHGIGNVARMAAEALYLQMASQLGRKGENVFDNLDEVVSGMTSEGVGTFLGSVGLSGCHFDGEAAYAFCARRHALKLIREGWLRTPGDETTLAAVDALVKAERLSLEALGRELAVDNDGVSLAIDLSLPRRILRLPASQQAQESVAYVEAYESARLQGTFRAAVEARGRERGRALAITLQQYLLQVASDPQQGVTMARAVAVEMQRRVDALIKDLRARRDVQGDEVDTAEAGAARRREELVRVAMAGFLVRGGRVSDALRRYLDAAGDYCGRALQLELSKATELALGDVTAALFTQAGGLEHLEARLRDAGRALEIAEASRTSGGPSADMELFTPAYGEVLYRRHAPPLADSALLLTREDDMLTWSEQTAAELAAKLCLGVGPAFDEVRTHSAEAFLAAQRDTVSPAAWYQYLQQRAVCAWALDRARLDDGGAGLATVDVLGVADEGQTLFAAQSSTLVSTQEDDRIIALRVTAGAPYTALQQFPAWKRAYDGARGHRMLHVLSSFHGNADVALRAFALGLIFKLIHAQGSYYYYRPADPLAEPERLARGLDNAVQVFTTKEGFAKEVMDRVEQLISVQLTTAQAIEKLDAYWEAGEHDGSLDELDRKLRRAARDYADELRRMLAASEGIRS